MSAKLNPEITTIEQINPAEVQITLVEDDTKYVGNPTYEFEWRGFEGHLGKIGMLPVSQDDADILVEGSVNGSDLRHTTRVPFGKLFGVQLTALDIIDIEMLGWERVPLAPIEIIY